MKKRRRKIQSPSVPVQGAPERDPLHFRLCHVCMHLNESQADIIQCEKCQRYLTIESLVEERLAQRRGRTPEEIEEEDLLEEHEMVFEGKRRGAGLNGLAVLW